MKDLGLPFSTLSRFGPVVPLALASARVWQALQPPAPVNTCFPAAGLVAAAPPALAPPPPAVAAPLIFLNQVLNWPWVTTLAKLRIVEWPAPHSSAHTTG